MYTCTWCAFAMQQHNACNSATNASAMWGLSSMEGNANGPNDDGEEPGGTATEGPGGTDAMSEETGTGFGNPNRAGPGGNNENSYDSTRKPCREQGLFCFHVKGGNSEHWADIKAFLRGVKMGLTLLSGGWASRDTRGRIHEGGT